MIEVKSEKFYVILPNFVVEEYVSLQHALQIEDKLLFAIQQRKVDSDTQKSSFSLQFINNGSSAYGKTITSGDWSAILSVLWDCDKANYRPVFKFCSPSGLVKELNYQGARGVSGVVSALKKLIELKTFKSWQDFEISEENKKLKIENEALKTKIAELLNEIATKNTSV